MIKIVAMLTIIMRTINDNKNNNDNNDNSDNNDNNGDNYCS